MSLPSFPDKDNIPSREEVINQIISSIAMEELGLSHIINAEGEKLQYALGTIEGVTGPEEPITIEDILKLNESMHKTLDSTMMNQFFLKEKLTHALSASVMQGPQGPTGPQGPVTIDVDTEVDNLDPGEPPYVLNEGTPEEVILKFGIPRGETGVDGANGADGLSAFEIAVEKGFEGTEEKWLDSLVGPAGPPGPQGTMSTIIPFSSGMEVDLTSGAGGQRSEVAAIGFGANAQFPSPNDPISLPVMTATRQMTFSMPDDGIITALSVYVSVAAAGVVNDTIVTQLYSSSAPNNSFMPLVGARVELAVPALASVGTTRNGIVRELAIPVSAQTRLMLVSYNVSQSFTSSPSVHISGGLKIESASISGA